MKKLILILAVTLCSTWAMAQSKPQNPAPYASISAQEFAQKIQSKKVVIVDVRTEKEYAEGHIDGAVNVVWGANFDANVENAKLSKKKTLAVYCRSGRRSKAAANALAQKGYKVVELNTGYVGWVKEQSSKQ